MVPFITPTCFYMFIRSFVLPFFRSFFRFFFRPSVRPSVRSFIRSYVRSFFRSFVLSLIRSFVRPSVRSFVCSFVCLCVCLSAFMMVFLGGKCTSYALLDLQVQSYLNLIGLTALSSQLWGTNKPTHFQTSQRQFGAHCVDRTSESWICSPSLYQLS